MKRISVTLILCAAAATFAGCSKSNDDATPASATSQSNLSNWKGKGFTANAATPGNEGKGDAQAKN
ncbi:hypothetical protein [Caballeronia sordidicola]|uniref:hypothetical protein n=1 Tax=Caballeronia sordidicola TaxID=196367 RepID=UPI000B149ED4|nr:hypothetical protein [Caballeronia sordidicola]